MKQELIIIVAIIVSIYITKRECILIGRCLQGIALCIFIMGHTIQIQFTYQNIINTLLGYIVAPCIVFFLYRLIAGVKLNLIYIVKPDFKYFNSVIAEEVIFRFILYKCIYSVLIRVLNHYSILVFFIALIITSVIFTCAHKIKFLYNKVELFVFAIILQLVSIMLPGLNFGLHLGRNSYISVLTQLQQEQTC